MHVYSDELECTAAWHSSRTAWLECKRKQHSKPPLTRLLSHTFDYINTPTLLSLVFSLTLIITSTLPTSSRSSFTPGATWPGTVRAGEG